MKKVFLVLLIIMIFVSGCLGPGIVVPEKEGVDCENNMLCIVENFLSCKKAFGTIIEKDNETFIQIIEPVEEKCEVYIKIEKSNDLPEILYGLDMRCKLSIIELASMQEMDITKMDCEGPLYDTTITAKNLGLLD
jgi:hypothetical protein